MGKRRATPILALLCAGALLSACGGDSEEEQVLDAFEEFNTVWNAGDARKLCGELIAPSQFSTERQERECRREIAGEVPTDLSQFEIEAVKIVEDRAVVIHEGGGETFFLREGGRWYLAGRDLEGL